MPDSEQMLPKKNAPEGPQCAYACMDLCVFSPVFCFVNGGKRQVVDRAGVERAAMGNSRFATLVRKLTNQSCFSFHTDSLNGALSCPSFTHSGLTNCAALLTFLVCFSLCLGLSCLVREWITALQQAAQAYVQQSNIWRRLFSPNGKTCVWLQYSSFIKYPFQNI